MRKYNSQRRPRAAVYLIRLPDGRLIRKHTSKVNVSEAVATAVVYKHGRVGAIIWPDEPRWLGDFGRLRAKRIA
jgi:hypothetical protein